MIHPNFPVLRSSVMRWLRKGGREFPSDAATESRSKKHFPHLTLHRSRAQLVLFSFVHYHTLVPTDSESGNVRLRSAEKNPTHRNFPREKMLFLYISLGAACSPLLLLCTFMLSSRFSSAPDDSLHPFGAALLFGIPFKCCEWNEESGEDNRGKVFLFFLFAFALARILSIFHLVFSPCPATESVDEKLSFWFHSVLGKRKLFMDFSRFAWDECFATFCRWHERWLCGISRLKFSTISAHSLR